MFHLFLVFVCAFALLLPGRLEGAECDYGQILRDNGEHLLMRTMDASELRGLIQVVASGENPKIRAMGTKMERKGKQKFQERLTLLGGRQSSRWAYPLVTRRRALVNGEIVVKPQEWRVGLLFSPDVLNKSRFFIDASYSSEQKEKSVKSGVGDFIFHSDEKEVRKRFGILMETLRHREEAWFRKDAQHRYLWAHESMGDVVESSSGEKRRVEGNFHSEAKNSLHVHVFEGLSLADLKGIWLPAPMLRQMVLPELHRSLGRPYWQGSEFFRVIRVDGKPTYTAVRAREGEGFDESSSQGNWYAASPNWKEIASRLDKLEGGIRLLDPEVFFGGMFSK